MHKDSLLHVKLTKKKNSTIASLLNAINFTGRSNHVIRCVEQTLGEIDYFQNKFVTAATSGRKLGIAQDYLALRLHAVCNVLYNLLMACPGIDALGNANFSLNVLKVVRRVFSANTKLVGSLLKGELKNPSVPIQHYLSFVSDKLMRVTVEVLAYCSEETKVGDKGLEISDAHIAAQGRLASSLVFERERWTCNC